MRLVWMCVLIGGLACSGPVDSDTVVGVTDSGQSRGFACDSSPSVTWDNWGRGFVTTHCQGCHASTAPDRYGAPEGVDFDTMADLREWRERVRVRVLETEDMPPAGGLSEDEKFLLEVLLDCGL